MANEALIQEVSAAPHATVVELEPPFGSHTVFMLHHYEHGKSTTKSVARAEDLASWISDIRSLGRPVVGGWEIREEPEPAEYTEVMKEDQNGK